MSDVTICIFNRETGQIRQYVECPDWMADAQVLGQPDLDYIIVTEKHPGDTTMVNPKTKALAVRPTLSFTKTSITANGTDKARLTVGVPFSAVVDGVVYRVNDGILEITSTMAAVYHVRVEHFPYQTLEVEITAT